MPDRSQPDLEPAATTAIRARAWRKPSPTRLDWKASLSAAADCQDKLDTTETEARALREQLDVATDPAARWCIERNLTNVQENIGFLRADVAHHQAEAVTHERRYQRQLGKRKPPASGASTALPRTARARGAGRPRGRSVARAASRGGDSGDDGSGSSEADGDPDPGRPLLLLAVPGFGLVNAPMARLLHALEERSAP